VKEILKNLKLDEEARRQVRRCTHSYTPSHTLSFLYSSPLHSFSYTLLSYTPRLHTPLLHSSPTLSLLHSLSYTPLLPSPPAHSSQLPWQTSAEAKREKEAVRPIYWANRPDSYVERTDTWKQYPGQRWADGDGSGSPAMIPLAEAWGGEAAIDAR
jgi:hypothetical protein